MKEKYMHYKGKEYEVLCIAIHSETGEKLVVYQDKDNNTYARPHDMFFEQVDIDGIKIPRF